MPKDFETIEPKLPLKPERGRGADRRGVSLAEVSSVRIDPETRSIIRREFGSLGNGLYFLAQGISQFRDELNLPQNPEAEEGIDRQGFLGRDEMRVLIQALDWRLEYAVDRAEARPFEALKIKLEHWIRKRPRRYFNKPT